MKTTVYTVIAALLCLLLVSCGQQTPDAPETTAAVTEAVDAAPLADGVYTADFKTDSSMFHINEAYGGKGVLTVAGGKMTIHVTLPSKNTVNLFCGSAENAKAAGTVLLAPTLDTVHYPDGTVEEVYGFDIPVPYLDAEFDCALVGKKGKWYDHKVSVSNPAPTIADGEYTAAVTLTGGAGKASVASPAKITVENGALRAQIVWSSPHYESMTVGGEEYAPVNTEGNSTFLIPVTLDTDITVSALTTAMSQPHLIEYTLRFDGETLSAK